MSGIAYIKLDLQKKHTILLRRAEKSTSKKEKKLIAFLLYILTHHTYLPSQKVSPLQLGCASQAGRLISGPELKHSDFNGFQECPSLPATESRRVQSSASQKWLGQH